MARFYFIHKTQLVAISLPYWGDPGACDEWNVFVSVEFRVSPRGQTTQARILGSEVFDTLLEMFF